jgi:Rieske Fe-S protein
MECGESVQAARADRLLDLGPATDYASDGLYAGLRDQGVFVIRKDGKVFAFSAFCTHRRCKLAAQPDRSFLCKCHGSTFDPGGKVTEGPATGDLPVFPVVLNEKGHLIAWINRLD